MSDSSPPRRYDQSLPSEMNAARVHSFGGPEAIAIERIPLPDCAADEVLVEVRAAGVGPWDAWVRSGHSVVPQPLPLTLGSDVAGQVRRVGAAVKDLQPGDLIYGATNARFTGGYAEFALCSAAMVAIMPQSLSFVDAASAPVIAVTAWQLLFKAAKLRAGDIVLIHGASGNVGKYAVQLARAAGIDVLMTTRSASPQILGFAPGEREPAPRQVVPGSVDAALDLVGGESQTGLLQWVRPGGKLVSIVTPPDADAAKRAEIAASFMLVDVNRSTLELLAGLFRTGALRADVGIVLPLAEVRTAHQMLDGTRTRPSGKIVLDVAGSADRLANGFKGDAQ